jgi:Arc/MetJ-type ribon-helix-helix transcriptional regulator
MTKQITVRLPDDQVDFLDLEVDSGRAASRAAAISRALRREQRRRRAEQDLRVILEAGDDPELAGLHDWAARHQEFSDVGE